MSTRRTPSAPVSVAQTIYDTILERYPENRLLNVRTVFWHFEMFRLCRQIENHLAAPPRDDA